MAGCGFRPKVTGVIGMALASALMVAAFARLSVSAAKAQTSPPARLAVDGGKLAIMIRRTLHAFNHANLTNNYTVFHALAAPGFRRVNSPAQLSKTFAKLRARTPDITGLLGLQPKLSRYPARDKQGRLHLMGQIASKTQTLAFRLVYAPTKRGFALFAITVSYKAVPAPSNVAAKGKLRGTQPAN